jgi:TRAP-type C4-dicarboxylate transport system substrate-binding protein
MVRLMRVGTLQAGLFSAVGLSEIEPDVAGLQSLPMAFQNYEEFDYVNDKLRPQFERRLLDKGFKLLFWADTGWVRYFFKEPTLTPEQLKQRKVFVWAGSAEQVDIIKRWGGTPVPLETADILTSLQTGLINAVSVPPIFAARSQFHSYAPHMIDLKWGILVGALVIKKETWDRIPEETQAFLLASGTQTGRSMIQAGRAEGEEAVTAMVKRGLTVHRLTPELEERWRVAADEVYPLIRGTLIPEDVFDEVQRLLAEYRSKPARP